MDEKDIEFETAKVCYQEHSESFRSLNQHLWQIPVIAMTLTGGLWFGVANINLVGREYLLLLAGLSNFGLIVVLWRTRYVMEMVLAKLEEFSENHHVKAKGKYIVVGVYSTLLAIAGLISLMFFFRLLTCQ